MKIVFSTDHVLFDSYNSVPGYGGFRTEWQTARVQHEKQIENNPKVEHVLVASN